MRTLLGLLLAIHGAIHLLGFLRAFDLARLPQLDGPTLVPLSPPAARAVGLLWLAVCVALIAAAGLRWTQHQAWWGVALAGAAASQALILLHWHDARAGTAANALILAAVIAGAWHRGAP